MISLTASFILYRSMACSNDWSCLICCELSPYKVLGKCNHPICITCASRLRELCDQKFCPVCREDLEKVNLIFIIMQINFHLNVSTFWTDLVHYVLRKYNLNFLFQLGSYKLINV